MARYLALFLLSSKLHIIRNCFVFVAIYPCCRLRLQFRRSVVVASSTTMRPYPVSHVESPELKATTGAERCVTGFPVGFGGWTAAKLYEQRVGSSNLHQNADHQTDNATASAARQEVGLNHSNILVGLSLYSEIAGDFSNIV